MKFEVKYVPQAYEADEYRLINDPRFIRRVAEARASARAGQLYSSGEVDEMLKAEALVERKRLRPAASKASQEAAEYPADRRTRKSKK